MQQKVIIISGPSGVGKGTVISRLLSEIRSIELTISATTRQMRQGEIANQTYYFLSDEAFSAHCDNQAFLEWCNVHGNRYGTLYSEIDRIFKKQKSVLLEIDTNGASKVRNRIENVISIFLAPPRMSALYERLQNRKTEDEETIKRRLSRAKAELKDIHQYDYVVINHHLEKTIQDLKTILKNERLIP